MATHDYNIANQSGAAFRTDLNNALAAIQSNNDNSTSPATTVAYQWWADTNTAIMKLRNSSNNAWIPLFTLAGGIDVESASFFKEDVTFDGATAGRDIVFDRSDNALEFADNAKATFGAGGDLEIYHDGSHSYVQDTGTGNLRIRGDDIEITDNASNNNMARFIEGGAVELYHNNIKMFATTVNGAETQGLHQITGAEGGNALLYLFADEGDDAADKFRINSQASNNTLRIQDIPDGGSWEDKIVAVNNAQIELYYNNVIKFETTSEGVKIDGGLLEIAHTSCHIDFMESATTNHRLRNGSGNFQIQKISDDKSSTTTQFLVDGGTGAVETYFDGTKVMESTGSGIAVFGKIGVGANASAQSINTISAQGSSQTTLFYGFGTIDLTSASDERVKNNVVDTAKGLDDILKLRIVDFTYTPEYAEDSTTVRTGGIAQEWQKVDPNLVNSENDDLLFIEYKRVIPHLIKAVQELSAKVAVLEAA